MKKTVTANVAGTVFHIEEDAYEQMQRYLAGIRANFSGSPGAEEIMGDIESRIAELFTDDGKWIGADGGTMDGKAEILVAKNRNGPIGMSPLVFWATTPKFVNASHEHPAGEGSPQAVRAESEVI